MDSPDLLYFSGELRDATSVKRCSEFTSLGLKVLAIGTSREVNRVERDAPQADPWEVLHLGNSDNGRFTARLAGLPRLLHPLLRDRARLRGARYLYARNLDMALLALALRAALRQPRMKVIYEVLDLHALLFDPGPRGQLVRALESGVMKRSQLLVVSSPGFVSGYFDPAYHAPIPHFLLENRMPSSVLTDGALSRAVEPPGEGEPWVISAVGKLRCERSLRLLARLAEALGERVQVRLAGRYRPHVAEALEDMVERLDNVEYLGPYLYPGDMRRLYDGVHLSWTFDLHTPFNSRLLLPVRLYDAGTWGVPALADASTTMGAVVDDEGLGFTVADARFETLLAFFEQLDADRYREVQGRLREVPVERFVDVGQHAALLERMAAL